MIVASERIHNDEVIPPWRGFHHITLVTADLDATIRFYGGVLGMRVGEVVAATERQGRHCFIKQRMPRRGVCTSSSWPTRACSHIRSPSSGSPSSLARCNTLPSPCRTKSPRSRFGGGSPRSVLR
jgi:hypothetical protein